ncbi:MAG: 50S ribosomal protein L6 [bacterium]|nr:50S ribosomal protein L6 [bacterium]
MSRVGKQPITIPKGVEFALQGQEVRVKGPKGELVRLVHPDVAVAFAEDKAVVSLDAKLSKKLQAKAKPLWGLWRTLIANMVQGVTQGFEKRLEIEGTGYRAALEGELLNLSLGFSHPVKLKVPKGLTVSVDKNVITVSGIDKGQVGEFAAAIRRQRPVEPYKGKGVRYQGEVVRRKEGKKAGTTAGAA